MFLGPLPVQFLWCGSRGVVTGECHCPGKVFGWVMHVRCHPHERQDSKFPNRTLHCDNMTNVINGVHHLKNMNLPICVTPSCVCIHWMTVGGAN